MTRTTRLLSIVALAASLTHAASSRFAGYTFDAFVRTDQAGRISEQPTSGRTTIYITDGDQYSIVVHNPLPVRVGVAVTVDGLNVIDGKRASAAKGRKWIIAPYGSITLRGWQTGSSKLRRFVFTDQKDSYAEWKQRRDKKNYTRNLGVIGVAYFWSSSELQAALRPPRLPLCEADEMSRSLNDRSGAVPEAPRKRSKSMEESRAGTGMGTQEHNQVTRVNFSFDTGMYRSRDAIVINYEFARPCPQPSPFEDDEADYAPDMHSSLPWRR